jgi:hypothetical protein
LTRDELIAALEELAGAIHGCAEENKECAKIIQGMHPLQLSIYVPPLIVI